MKAQRITPTNWQAEGPSAANEVNLNLVRSGWRFIALHRRDHYLALCRASVRLHPATEPPSSVECIAVRWGRIPPSVRASLVECARAALASGNVRRYSGFVRVSRPPKGSAGGEGGAKT